jgi:hypothetical protein
MRDAASTPGEQLRRRIRRPAASEISWAVETGVPSKARGELGASLAAVPSSISAAARQICDANHERI